MRPTTTALILVFLLPLLRYLSKIDTCSSRCNYVEGEGRLCYNPISEFCNANGNTQNKVLPREFRKDRYDPWGELQKNLITKEEIK